MLHIQIAVMWFVVAEVIWNLVTECCYFFSDISQSVVMQLHVYTSKCIMAKILTSCTWDAMLHMQIAVLHFGLHLVCCDRVKCFYNCLLFLFFSPDINECMLSPSVCEQSCTDTAGSFVCGCNIGFELQSDESSCIGEFSLNVSVYQSWAQLEILGRHRT